jgi:hypothetical protein
MQGSASRPSHPALREGLVFGVTLGIIVITGNLLQNFVGSNMLGNILGVMVLIVVIALNLLVGIRASQRTGRVGTGALAGLIMELISFLFGAILTLTKIFVFDTPLHHILTHATSELAQQFITVSSISFVVYLLLGAVIGAIGGLIGRKRAQLPLQV